MYAVVATGGKQYKVKEGDNLQIEKINGEVGSKVTFDNVLLFSDGDNLSVGQPMLENISVNGEIIDQSKAKKVIIFKTKRRKRYRKTQGHRQNYTTVKIEGINS